MSIGEELRKARTTRGITIDQLSSVTKISPGLLRAIDSDDFARLPGGVFTRGFLRAYAREVGLDPEETVARFREEFGTPETSGDADREQAADAASGASLVSAHESAPPEHSTDLGQLIAIAVIVVAAVSYLGLHNRQAPVSASVPTPPPPAVEAAVGTAGLASEPIPVASEAADLKIDFEATGPCWVAVTADGKLLVQRLMNAGERETSTAIETLTLRVGDPAAFKFSLNGVPGRPMGEAGRPITIQITPQNYRDYLAR